MHTWILFWYLNFSLCDESNFFEVISFQLYLKYFINKFQLNLIPNRITFSSFRVNWVNISGIFKYPLLKQFYFVSKLKWKTFLVVIDKEINVWEIDCLQYQQYLRFKQSCKLLAWIEVIYTNYLCFKNFTNSKLIYKIIEGLEKDAFIGNSTVC